MLSDSAISFSHVSKKFRIGASHQSLGSLFARMKNMMLNSSQQSPTDKQQKEFWALKDINFQVKPGKAIGIIGPNGAGKSTCLKLLAGILRPDEGEIKVKGRLAALIEVGAGFHGDLTGRENVFLNGSIMGMSRKEIKSKFDDIVSFAGIESFIDTPVKRYSSGMYARLGFSIAAHIDPDVLIVDEVLSVGDAVFRLRCMEKMTELMRKGVALVFVTHNLDQMQNICDRAIVLKEGIATEELQPKQAIEIYLKAMSESYNQRPTDILTSKNNLSEKIILNGLAFTDENNKELMWAESNTPFKVRIGFEAESQIENAIVELNVRSVLGDNLLSFNSGRSGYDISIKRGEQSVELKLPGMPIKGDQYYWNVRVWDKDTGATLLETPYQFPLMVDDKGKATGILVLDHQWKKEHDNNTMNSDVTSALQNEIEFHSAIDNPINNHNENEVRL